MNYVFLLDLIWGVGLFSLFAIYLSVHSLAFRHQYVTDVLQMVTRGLIFMYQHFSKTSKVVPEGCERYGIGGAFCAQYGSDYAWAYVAFRPRTN